MPAQPAASISCAVRAAPRAEATVVIHNCTFVPLLSFAYVVECGGGDVNCLNMGWKRRDREERGYHHGNLREALIKAARELIKEKGPAGFTFAAAARSAGVSAPAPYRPFRDRQS